MCRIANHSGVTLLEVILATIILTVVATTILQFSRQPGDQVKQHVCDLNIERLQLVAQQYRVDYGQFPSSAMTELVGVRYLGEALPLCPVDGQLYRLNPATGKVAQHGHTAP